MMASAGVDQVDQSVGEPGDRLNWDYKDVCIAGRIADA